MPIFDVSFNILASIDSHWPSGKVGSPSGPIDTPSAEQTSHADTSSINASLHAPDNNGNKGKSAEKPSVIFFSERAASPDASTAAIQSQPTKFYVSAASNAIEGFWNHFATNYDMEKATADPMDSLFGLHFHPYDPNAIKANENECTLVVTDISLFITDALLYGTFFCFGNITKCHTKLAKLYRTAYITFDLTDMISELNDIWGILCGGTIAADLAEIAHEVSAKSINIPFSMNSYNPKPYAYCHFTSQTAMEAAMEISCTLKHIGLTWHSPDEVQSLCHHCGHSECNPNYCGSSSSHPQRMGIDQESSYIPAINWTEISDALQAVVREVAALTAQMANMNNRLKMVKYTLANPSSQISSGSSAPYIPTSMHGWDDPPTSPKHDNNSGKLIDVNSPPTASAPGFTPIPHFSPLPSSVVAFNLPSDMK
ncbi:hypothetical protein C1646_775542 [Rhizophagus diaphanus]|nr:hypothetical protein C1646_775542 [Rhizophagus diaphanus] [Rhizophagus sp. MUCL 43196]